VNDFYFDFIGCGALNWDIFFEVEDLDEINFESLSFCPGREIVIEREKFFRLLNLLEKEGTFLFECGGGSSANTIYALSSWGFKTIFLGAAGKDNYGQKILYEFEKTGVDNTFIIKEGETSLALIILDKKKDRFIAVSPGNSENFLENINFKFNELSLNGWFHLSSFASEAGKNFQKKLLENISSKISFDPGEIYAGLGKDFLFPWFRKTEILFLSEYEFKKINLSFQELFNLGIEKIFLKKGKEGAVFISQTERIKVPVYPASKIVDNTGAGDYFNAGVLAGLKLGFRDEIALKVGIFSASLSLRDYGRKGCLTKDEFQNYINLVLY